MKRYEQGELGRDMHEDPTGTWCLHADVAPVLERAKAIEEALQDLRIAAIESGYRGIVLQRVDRALSSANPAANSTDIPRNEVECVDARGAKLTEGKFYRVQSLSDERRWPKVVNDEGVLTEYVPSRFRASAPVAREEESK